ncbi:MAG: hypothetical protein EBT08_18875 [Betaproteobacteria bacterium]|jgi:hypothetical protein|nr:hypothetical protein [Betaproteobacteria bacterium]
MVALQSSPITENLLHLEFSMPCLSRRILTALVALLFAALAHAHEVGWMQIQTAGATPETPTSTVAL